MLSAGIPRPRRALKITAAIAVGSWLSVAWGAFEMAATGVETTRTALMIGVALLPAIIAPLMAINFWWATRIEAALRRGEGAIGRWRIPAQALATFIVEDRERSSHGMAYMNDWTPPRAPPAEGIEIIFGTNGVLAHDTYFTLSKTGFYTFGRVGLLPRSPLSIEFETKTTHVSANSAVIVRRIRSVLRLPITRADCPETKRVLDHYRRESAGTIAANPDFYPNRVRFGLIAAPICLVFAGAGFVLQHQGIDFGILPTLMTIVGGVFAFTAILIAVLAAIVGRARRKRG